MRTLLAGADLVLPDRVAANHTLVIEHGRIAEVSGSLRTVTSGERRLDLSGHIIVPGFIDVHVHGVGGRDVQDGAGSIAAIAAALPRFGVAAFCPTTVACSAADLSVVLNEIRALRSAPNARSSRVLPAHLESNFVNPEYRGAQPAGCLRSPRSALEGGGAGRAGKAGKAGRENAEFHGADILAEIERAAPDVGIVTLASELDGGLDLIKWLTSRGHRVSLGHSAATFDEATAAIAAGARQATHLFNRMPPISHRAPGLAGAVLQAEEVAAELICDGAHVHPAMVRAAISAKQPSRVMAITDATAVAGLPPGARASLGGRPIVAGETTALLPDGTIAGSRTTMDRVFQMLIGAGGQSLVTAAVMCATTPARELGMVGYGVLVADASADLAVLDANLSVVQTYVGGQLVYARNTAVPAAV